MSFSPEPTVSDNSYKMAEIVPTVKLEGKTIKELLAAGIRAYVIGKSSNAVQYLSKAAELCVAESEKHDSLGQVYLFYGKSLLEVSREDGDPLGDAVPKDVAVAEECEDEDGEDVDNGEEGETAEGGDAVEQNAPEDAKSDEKKDGSSKGVEFNGEGKEAEADKNDEGEDESANDITMEDGDEVDDEEDGDGDKGDDDIKDEAGASGEKIDGEEDDDPSDLQVAWEVLELAKLIFQEKGDARKSELAETLIVLGEVSLESENFESAVNDIKEGLEIQKAIYDDSNRKLAETYYKLGIALSTNNQIDEAIENFNVTIQLLNNRIKKLEGSDKGSEKDEVVEMQKLIPEIEEKIADMKNYKEEAAKEQASEPSPDPAPSSPEKKVTNISHLVKRKRKSLDDSEGSSSPAKKTALSS